MAVIFDDNLTGTAGQNLTTSGVYSKVTGFAGNITYRSGGGVEFAGGGDAIYYRNDFTLEDGENEITFVFSGPHTGTNAYVSVINRTMETDNRWISAFLQAYFGTPIPFALYSTEFVGEDSGGYPFNETAGDAQFAAGTYRFKLSSNGYLHRLFVNGVEFVRGQDNTDHGLTTGRAGLIFGGAWNAGYVARHRCMTGFETNQMLIASDSTGQGDYVPVATLAWMGRENVWPTKLYRLLEADGFVGDLGNASVSGRKITDEITNYNSLNSGNAIPWDVNLPNQTTGGWGNGQCRRPNAAVDVVMVSFGINDLAQGRTASQLKDDLDTLVAAYQGLGFTVIVLSIKVCDEGTVYIPSGFNTAAAEVNSHILAGNTGADLAVDVSGCPEWDSFDSEFCADGIHPLPESHTAFADFLHSYPGLKAAFGLGTSETATFIGGGFGIFYGD